MNFLVHGFCETTKYPVRSLFESGLSLSWDCIYVNWLTQTQLWIILGLIVHFSCCFSESFNSRCEWCIKPQYRRHVSWSGAAGIWYISRWLLSSGQSTSAWYCSPDILSSKVGQPDTNCKRMFLNGFWSRNMSSITYQKSPKIRVGDVDKKQGFLEPYTAQHGNEVTCTGCCVAWV